LVEIGLTSRIEGASQRDLDGCRHALAIAGILDARRSTARGPGWMVLTLSGTVDSVAATAVAELNVVPAGEAYRLTQRSTLRLNPLGFLAAANIGGIGGGTYDGSTNFIGPTPTDTRDLIERQFRYVLTMVEALCRCLCETLPPHVVLTEQSARLRRIELARDVAVEDSRSAALLLSHSVLLGTRWTERDVYRVGSADGASPPITRWWRKKKGAAFKAYAKSPARQDLPGCLREEVSCQGRKALKEIGCEMQTDWSREGFAALLTDFVTGALPRLDTLHDHVAMVLAGSARPADLFASLSPMVLPMAGITTGGRPTSIEQLAELRHAFDCLVLTGQYRARGLKKGLTLRSILDSLCRPEGPLEKHPTLCLYTVKPQFVRASRDLARSREWQGAERVPGSEEPIAQAR
jgi:hypothetical protein